MLGEDLDPELLKALEASQKEYEAEQKKNEKGNKLLADILLLGEMLQISSAVLSNLKTNFKQYDKDFNVNADLLKKVDFQHLINTLYDLSGTDLDKVKAHLMHDLETSVSYVNQFNAILNLELSSKDLFKDMIARPLPDIKPTANDIKKEAEVEEDEDLKKAIALSLATKSPETTTAPLATQLSSMSSASSSSPSNPEHQKESILLTRQLRFVLKIPGTDVEACLLALLEQKHWDNSLKALDAYEKSTKEYSARGLITFMQEGPKDNALVNPITPHEIEKKPSNRDEKKRRLK